MVDVIKAGMRKVRRNAEGSSIGFNLHPGCQLKQIITWAHLEILPRHRLCTHSCTYDLDCISNNLQLSTLEEEFKSFRIEMGKRVLVQQEEYSFMSGTSMMTMYHHSQIMNATLYQLRAFQGIYPS
jgi:hypothetical protein